MINTIWENTEGPGGRTVSAYKPYKISASKLIALIIMTFSFMGGYSFFSGNVGTARWYFFYYGRFIVVILYAIYSFGKRSKLGDRIVTRWMVKLFITPVIVMVVYSSLLWILYHAQFRYVTRGISNSIFLTGSYISGIYLAKALNKDSVKIGLFSAIATMIISMVMGLFALGGSFFSKMIEGNNIYVELHEALFVIGLYLIVYMFRQNIFKARRNKLLFALGILSFVVGGKRIGFLAVIISMAFGLFLKNKSSRTIKFACHVAEWIILVFTITYTWLSVSGTLDVIMVKYNIDMMGRGVLYRYFRKFCEYTPTFLGHGVGFVDRTFGYTTSAELYNMASVKALHNDLLKMYIEIGFVGSICWSIYWLKTLPHRIEKKFGTITLLVCLCLLIYSFITYTTDNTAGYFNYQMHLAIIITSITMNAENNRIIPIKR